MKFSIEDFFSICDQIRSFLRVWSHFLKKSAKENFIFCAINRTAYGDLCSNGISLCCTDKTFYENRNYMEIIYIEIGFINKVSYLRWNEHHLEHILDG